MNFVEIKSLLNKEINNDNCSWDLLDVANICHIGEDKYHTRNNAYVNYLENPELKNYARNQAHINMFVFLRDSNFGMCQCGNTVGKQSAFLVGFFNKTNNTQALVILNTFDSDESILSSITEAKEKLSTPVKKTRKRKNTLGQN